MAGVRRTWDKDLYEKIAKEKAATGEDTDVPHVKAKSSSLQKEEFREAEDGAAGPMGSQRAYIKSRDNRVDLEGKVGKTEIINPTSADSAHEAGFWCEVCSCLLKDSASYLDHINDQKMLGFSMRTERADVDSVKRKLEELKSKMSIRKEPISKQAAFENYEAKLKNDQRDLEARKKQKKEEVKQQKQIIQKRTSDDDVGVDPDIAAAMGFAGFGTSKK